METADTPASESLTALLEDERASVEIEVALFSSATEHSERETLSSMGAQEVGFCVALREQLERRDSPPTTRISAAVPHVLGIERYDERLNAFADHQMRVAESIPALLASATDDELRALLRDIEDAHLQAAAWSRRRATAFVATRLLVFQGNADAFYPDAPAPITANGTHVSPPSES